MKTLYEITNQESGIVMYNDQIIVTNWINSCPNGGLPIMSPINTLMEFPQEEELKIIEQYNVDDVRTVLSGKIVEEGINEDGNIILQIEGMKILEDYHGDIFSLWGYDIGCGSFVDKDENGKVIPTAGTIYRLQDDVVIIAPDGWC